MAFRPMFRLYLDIQKQKDLDAMDDTEARGRWKSYCNKWYVDRFTCRMLLMQSRNKGELAEGWYDPETYQKAVADTTDDSVAEPPRDARAGPEADAFLDDLGRDVERRYQRRDGSDSDSDDSVGPALPGQESSSGRRAGPSIPTMEDLALKRENETEDAYARRKAEREDAIWARKQERTAQKEKMDELAPRAEAGTRERQLEKKREVNEKMKSFRDKGDGVVEIPDSELMGGGDDLSMAKTKQSEYERKKTERELRREEIARARNAEREERLSEYRTKEQKTIAMLQDLARARFGPGAGGD